MPRSSPRSARPSRSSQRSTPRVTSAAVRPHSRPRYTRWSRTRIRGYSPRSSGMYPKRIRSPAVIDAPRHRTVPASRSTSPKTARMAVVLPARFGPRKAGQPARSSGEGAPVERRQPAEPLGSAVELEHDSTSLARMGFCRPLAVGHIGPSALWQGRRRCSTLTPSDVGAATLPRTGLAAVLRFTPECRGGGTRRRPRRPMPPSWRRRSRPRSATAQCEAGRGRCRRRTGRLGVGGGAS